jgi:selenide,water dikinase
MVAQAGAIVVGGHSVNDKEPKYGLAVTGVIHPDKVKKKGGAQPGDVLLLTKPLGVGVVTTALKQQKANEAHVATAVASMKQLNKQAARAAELANANGMTDITGFGLLGHAHEMAEQAGVDFQFSLEKLPFLPGAVAYGEMGIFPGGKGNNNLFFAPHVSFDDDVPLVMQDMLWTPETSGGLLVAVPPENVAIYQDNCDTAVVVGEVVPGNGRIWVKKE